MNDGPNTSSAALTRTTRLGATDRDWLAVAAAAAGLVLSLGTLSVYTFGVFVGPLAREFGWSRTQLSGTITVSQFVLALSSPVWGVLADRFGPRAILLPSIAALTLLAGSLAFLTPHLWHLYLIFGCMSLLAGGVTPLGYSSALICRFDRHLGLALGLALMGVGLGAAILPPLAQGLVASFGWRAAYTILAGAGFAVGIPAALVATRNVRGSVARSPENLPVALLPSLRTRTFLLMCAIFLVLGATTVGTLAHLVPMMIDRGAAPAAASRIAALTGLAALLGRGGIGWILDRISGPRVLAAVALLAACAFLLLGLGAGGASAYLAVVLLGGAIGAEVDFIAFLTRRYFAAALFGRLYGIGFSAYVVGAGSGPLLLARSFDHWGGYRPCLLLFAALGASAAVMALLIAPSPTGREAES